MSISKLFKDKIYKRDLGRCLHCGTENDLAIHHRKNRQMGGSKNLDRLDNLLLICNTYNVAMESDASVRRQAIEHGHKLSSWDDFDTPLLDIQLGVWFTFDVLGNKHEIEETEKGLF